ncbi:hypothetical protein AMATHDRAFT_195969 [Amanita thiersii Skay4041]|uniref:G-protein coupled receptors family 1 profile domain-containing protein n=1 Tax=Amanita thiersii Skay4041 TaxID=703135 RepID=A0A2A9NDU3_9AGAR|nr:hypothetical protein AMATHDRAFT_195969 [Amanita thiersii Skay4041]
MSTDSEILSELGFHFIIKAVRIAFGAACYGVYILLISASTVILCRKGLYYPRTLFLLIVTLVMFGGSSLFLAMDISDLVRRLQIILMRGADAGIEGIEQRIAVADKATKPLLWTGEILFLFMLILGDSVVLWRTWALCCGYRILIIIPFLTWLGSIIAAFYELGCDIETGWSILTSAPSAASVGADACIKADISSFTLSYATNIICTAFIFYKTWTYRQCMKQYLGAARRRTKAEKILTLLVESGMLYLVIYTLQAIPIYGGSTPGSLLTWEVINAIIQQAFGMYPTALVVLVEMQKSLWDTNDILGSTRSGVPVGVLPGGTRLSSGLDTVTYPTTIPTLGVGSLTTTVTTATGTTTTRSGVADSGNCGGGVGAGAGGDRGRRFLLSHQSDDSTEKIVKVP